MAVTATDTLEALGAFSADFDYSPELLARITRANGDPNYAVLLLRRRGGALLAAAVALTADPSAAGTTVTGRSLRWYLGQGPDGPVIPERTYLSGVSRLTNGDFHLTSVEANDPTNPLPTRTVADLWKLDQATNWQIVAGTGPGYALVAYAPFTNDTLVSGESIDVKPGEVWRVSAVTARVTATGALGRAVLKLVCTGRFATPNLASPYRLWSPSTRVGIDGHSDQVLRSSDPGGIVPGPVLEIYSNQPNLVPNGSFEDPGGVGSLNGYISSAGVWQLANDGGHNGTYYMHTDGGPAFKLTASTANGATGGPIVPRAVTEGEVYEMWLVGRVNGGSPATDGELTLFAGLQGSGGVPGVNQAAPTLRPDGSTTNAWRLARATIRIDHGIVGLTPQIMVSGQTTGRWDVDDVTLIRTVGNIDTRFAPYFNAQPGRGYRATVAYRVEGLPETGTVQMRAVAHGPGRPQITLTGTTLALDQPGLQHAEWVFVAPSGYETFTPFMYSADVQHHVWVGEWTIEDTDPSTIEITSVTDFASTTSLSRDCRIPSGAETAHIEITAEDQALGWAVRDVRCTRVDQAPTPIATIIRELLRHPRTGQPLLSPGNIWDTGAHLRHDWLIRNATLSDALAALAKSGLSPVTLGTRVNPSGTVDVLPVDSLWGDRRDIVLTPDDFRLLSKFRRVHSVETRVSDVEVVGAEKIAASGSRYQVTGSATSDLVGEDLFGNPIQRTRVVSDTSVTTDAFADERAAYEIDRDAHPKDSVRVSLSDYTTLLGSAGAFTSGDKIYLFDRKAGIVDDANEMRDAAGQPVWPLGLKVLSLKSDYGAGYSLSILNRDGSEWPIPDELVRWSKDTKAELELGDPRPEFALDSAGGAAVDQFHRFWVQNRRS